MDIQPCLCRNPRRIFRLNADDILNLMYDTVRLCTRQIDFIDDRHDIQIVVQRQINIGQCLCLNALCRIHDENRTVAGRKAAGHLVIEVYMSWCIDQVECVFFPVICLINRADRLRFDRDATLSLQLHIVKHLLLHLPAGQKSCHLNDAVCQR